MVTVIMMATMILKVSAQEVESFSIPLTFPDKEGTLHIGLITGSIKVTSHATNDVTVSFTNTGNKKQSRGPETKNGMKKITGGAGYGIVATEKNNKVEIGTENPNHDVNLHVTVPKNFSLKLSTINDGDIEVENVIGNHEISNINGSVNMRNVGGSVVANTLNEDINISFTSVKPNTPMAFTNLNGDINLSLPATTKFDVKTRSENGNVYTDFDIQVATGAEAAKTTKKNGYYKVSKDNSIKGKVNGGGSEIIMTTMNGDITIKKM